MKILGDEMKGQQPRAGVVGPAGEVVLVLPPEWVNRKFLFRAVTTKLLRIGMGHQSGPIHQCLRAHIIRKVKVKDELDCIKHGVME